MKIIDICLFNWKTEFPTVHQENQFLKTAKYANGILSSVDYPLREPPTGLLILAAILEERGYSVEIIDCTILQSPIGFVLDVAHKYRMIGFTALTNTVEQVLDLAHHIKQKHPEIFMIMGGPHVSFEYENILPAYPDIDAICIGEADLTFPWMLDQLLHKPAIDFVYDGDSDTLPQFANAPGKVVQMFRTLEQSNKLPKGIAFYTENQVFNTGFPDPVDLAPLPLPARHLISRVYSVADIIINRGCPNECSFCSRTKLFPTVRLRPLEQILAEVDFVSSMANYRFVNFYDNININHQYFTQFLDALIVREFPLPWGAELRADVLTEEETVKLYQANCKLVATGVESASPEVLKRNFKFQNPEKVARGIRRLKKAGIAVQAYFVIGLPGDTEELFQGTLTYLEALPLEQGVDHVDFFIITPYPGSDIAMHPEKYGVRILSEDFSCFDCREILMETETLTSEQMQNMREQAEKLKKRLGF